MSNSIRHHHLSIARSGGGRYRRLLLVHPLHHARLVSYIMQGTGAKQAPAAEPIEATCWRLQQALP